MFALEIINALNDPDNPAKVRGINAKFKKNKLDPETGAPVWTPRTLGHRPTQGEKLCLGRGKRVDCKDCNV